MSDYWVGNAVDRRMEVVRPKIEEIVGNAVKLTYDQDFGGLSFRYRLSSNGMYVASFSMTHMPECPAIVVSHSSGVSYDLQGKGIGKILHSARIEACLEVGVVLMQATVVKGNVAEERLMDRYGWDKLSEFYNKDTGRDVCLYQKDLRNDQ